MWVLFHSIYYSYHFIFIHVTTYECRLHSVLLPLSGPAPSLAFETHTHTHTISIKFYPKEPRNPGQINLDESLPSVSIYKLWKKYTDALTWKFILFSKEIPRLLQGYAKYLFFVSFDMYAKSATALFQVNY